MATREVAGLVPVVGLSNPVKLEESAPAGAASSAEQEGEFAGLILRLVAMQAREKGLFPATGCA